MRLLAGLAPLRQRDFGLYWFGQATSMIGTWADVTATSWLLYELTHSPFLLGLGGVFRAAPILLFSLVGGAAADRLPRRVLMIVAISGQMATAFALAVLVHTGVVEFWHVYLITAMNGTFAAIEQPARQALYPSLVSRAQLQNAVALHAMLFRLSTLIGPAVAGALIAQVGLSAPFFFNAASFLAILGALMVIRVPPPRARAAAGLRADTSEGITYVLRHPVLPAIFLAEIAVNIFGHNSALITIYAREVLHTDATGLGLMLSAIGAGALCGVFALIAIGDVRRKGWLLLIGGMTYSLTLAAFGVSRDLTIAVAVLAVLGVADSMWGAMRNTILQTAIDDNYRGRVMSLSIITTRGFTSISQVQTGVSVSIVGPQGAALIGASLIAGTIMWTLRSKGLRRYESVPQTGPALGSGS